MANVNIRLPDSEAEILADYVEKTGRTRTDVLREFIRSLAPAKNRPSRKA